MTEPQTIFITGAGSGLGRALALAAGKQGMMVAVSDLHETRAMETCRELQKTGVQNLCLPCDVRHEADIRRAVQRVVQRWGHLDIMVNNAGIAGAGLFEAIAPEDWDFLLDVNLLGVVRGCRAAITPMKRQGYGHIVNIASMAALTPAPAMSNYNVSKAGVVSLSETLRAELAPLNINITLVCPSFFRTNLGESLRTPDPVTTARFKKLIDNGDLSAEEIAQMILKAVEKQRFLLIPHREARKAWRQKRWQPERFFLSMEKLAARFRR